MGEDDGKQGRGEMDVQGTSQAKVDEEFSIKDLAHDRQGIVLQDAHAVRQIDDEENQFVLHSSGEEDADEIEWDR